MAIGIVAEFNPFHNGHKYLISEAKRCTADDSVVTIMSGAWVQRGEPAITDKHTRAKIALENGADLVLELPAIYSLNTAQKFAHGAIATLASTGIISSLVFGSESGNTDALIMAADALINEPPEVSAKIKKLTSDGMSFAAARAIAFDGIIQGDLLSSPNDILAIEYIRATKEIGADFDLHAIPRLGASHDGAAVGDIASASLIRQLMSNPDDAARYLPRCDFQIYNTVALDTAIIAKLRTCSADYLRTINDVSEGLENRFIKAAKECDSVKSLCKLVKSKRYAMTRIRRIAYSTLLGLTKELAYKAPSYIRVLGFNSHGAALLKQIKTTAALPVITKPADFGGDEIFSFGNIAEDIFSLCAPTPELRCAGRDLTQSPVVLI